MAANSFGYNGFTTNRHLMGGVIRANSYQIMTSGSTGFNDNIFGGDVVKLNADGTIESAVAGDTNLIGIFAGVTYLASSGNQIVFAPNWVASTAVITGSTITAWVYDDPNITYSVTGDTATAGAQTQVGNNADFVQGTGSAVTGQSGSYLDLTTIGSTSAQFRIIGFPDLVGNVITNTLARLEVRFNEHLFLSTTGV